MALDASGRLLLQEYYSLLAQYRAEEPLDRGIHVRLARIPKKNVDIQGYLTYQYPNWRRDMCEYRPTCRAS